MVPLIFRFVLLIVVSAAVGAAVESALAGVIVLFGGLFLWSILKGS